MADTWSNCCVVLVVIMVTVVFRGASCQCLYTKTIYAEDSWKRLTWPDDSGYISKYSNNEDCSWLITSAREDEVVHLRDVYVDLEEQLGGICYDFIAIYDGDRRSGAEKMRKFCSNQRLQFYSSGEKMTVRFVSDDFVTATGFTVEYRSIPANEVPYVTWPAFTTEKPRPSKNFDTAAVIGGPVITLICIIFLVGVCRLCCRNSSQPPPRAYPAQASAPFNSDSTRNQGGVFLMPSSASPNYEGHTNAGFSSLGEAPPAYDVAIATSHASVQGNGIVSNETEPVAPPSYEDVIMMSETAAEPKPE